MKNLIKLLIFPILMASCTDSVSQDYITNPLEVIAASKLYHAYGEAITKNLNDIRKDLFDLDEVTAYIETNFEEVPDLCQLDFTKMDARGIDIYMNNLCALNQSLELLKQKLPAYDQLSKQERISVHQIYIEKFRDPSTVYIKSNN